jgi:hypothetical protein
MGAIAHDRLCSRKGARMRTKSETLRRLKLGDLRRLLRIRCGHTLPDDDAGREYLWELLLPISLAAEANLKMTNAVEVHAPWMKSKEATGMKDQIRRLQWYLRISTPRAMGQRLRVTREEWIKLKLKTILPFDMTDNEIAEFRKAKKRARDQRRRQAAGAKSRDQSLSRLKPWVIAGESRATWYRKNRETNKRQEQKPQRETNTRRTKLLNSRASTCLTEQAEKPKGLPTSSQGVEAESINSTEQAESTEEIPPASSERETVSPPGCSWRETVPSAPNGGLRVRIWIKEIRHPAIKSGPDDDLDDFKIAARMTGF